MAFISNPTAYDQIRIGDNLLPGEVHLSGEITRALAKVHKRGSGDDGGTPVFRGLQPCEFSILLQLHTDEDEEAWAKLQPVLLNLNNPSSRNQFSIAHSQLKRLGITRVVVHAIGETAPLSGGPIKVTIKCLSVKDRSGGTHKPKPQKYSISGKIQTPYRPGLPLTLAGYNSLTLNARSATALQQAKIDNGVPIDLARPDGLETPGTGSF